MQDVSFTDHFATFVVAAHNADIPARCNCMIQRAAATAPCTHFTSKGDAATVRVHWHDP
jgi:hypothetical protein